MQNSKQILSIIETICRDKKEQDKIEKIVYKNRYNLGGGIKTPLLYLVIENYFLEK